MKEGDSMSFSKSELIDSIERLDEIESTLNEIRHRLVKDFEAKANDPVNLYKS